MTKRIVVGPERIVFGSRIGDLHEQWRKPVEPGRIEHLNNLLREHLSALEEWRLSSVFMAGSSEPKLLQEIVRRLREFSEVHRLLAEHFENVAEHMPVENPPPAESAVPCDGAPKAVGK